MKANIKLMMILIVSLIADQTTAQKFFIRFTDKHMNQAPNSDNSPIKKGLQVS